MIKSTFIKLIMSFLLVIILVNIFCIPTSHAIGDIIGHGKGFLDAADTNNPINTSNLQNTSNYLYNILLAIGIIVAVIVAMVLGIQFMTASAGEKAKVKEALIPFVAGCIVVFGAFIIWKVVVTIGTNAEDGVRGISYADKTDDEKETSLTDKFNSWYDNKIKMFLADNYIKTMPEGAQNWSKDDWYDFYIWAVNRHYPIDDYDIHKCRDSLIPEYLDEIKDDTVEDSGEKLTYVEYKEKYDSWAEKCIFDWLRNDVDFLETFPQEVLDWAIDTSSAADLNTKSWVTFYIWLYDNYIYNDINGTDYYDKVKIREVYIPQYLGQN